MIKPKLFSAYYSGDDPFGIFSEVVTAHHATNLEAGGVLILWGGEDISPSLYNQPSTKSHASNTPSKRDIVEKHLYEAAVKLGMPIIGICRGAQLGCALSGGSLFQHIEGGHHSNHFVDTYDGNVFNTSSCHHQALNLSEVDHELLAWDHGRMTKAWTDKDEMDVVIPEVVNIPSTKTFAIQGHPEWMSPKAKFVEWCAQQFSERYL